MRDRETVWRTINDVLYADEMRKAEADFEYLPLLAHYTSVTTLESIVDNNELWFSNPLFMNDIEEVRWGITEGADTYFTSETIATALDSDELVNFFRSCINDCVRNFETNHVFDTYILCLSEHDAADEDGLLSMWRGYGDGGKGVAIVFDGKPMKDLPDSPLLVGKVEYMSTAQRREWFQEQTNLFASLVVRENIQGEEIRFATEALFGRLRTASLFSKHSGFAEEREWRIAYLPERDHQNLLHAHRGYFVTARGVEPKLKLKIAPLAGAVDDVVSLEALVHTILLGPSLQAPLLHQSVKRMLELKERPELSDRVRASRIPYRPAGIQF